jgi:hypothetical protein
VKYLRGAWQKLDSAAFKPWIKAMEFNGLRDNVSKSETNTATKSGLLQNAKHPHFFKP